MGSWPFTFLLVDTGLAAIFDPEVVRVYAVESNKDLTAHEGSRSKLKTV